MPRIRDSGYSDVEPTVETAGYFRMSLRDKCRPAIHGGRMGWPRPKSLAAAPLVIFQQAPGAQVLANGAAHRSQHRLLFAAGEEGFKVGRLFFARHDADFNFFEAGCLKPVMQIALGKSQPAVAV